MVCMEKFRFILKEVWKGNSLWRALTHEAFRRIEISGTVFDLGSGSKQAYFSYLTERPPVTVLNFDQKGTTTTPPVNLETDRIPRPDQSADMVIMCNILEHLYAHDFALKEAYRVLKSGGRLVGFVPFFCHYHAGPHDYFRYTFEALEKMFEGAGFSAEASKRGITALGYGPFAVSYHSVFFLSIPKRTRRRLKLIITAFMPLALALDRLFIKIYPNLPKEFPLGYQFDIKK